MRRQGLLRATGEQKESQLPQGLHSAAPCCGGRVTGGREHPRAVASWGSGAVMSTNTASSPACWRNSTLQLPSFPPQVGSSLPSRLLKPTAPAPRHAGGSDPFRLSLGCLTRLMPAVPPPHRSSGWVPELLESLQWFPLGRGAQLLARPPPQLHFLLCLSCLPLAVAYAAPYAGSPLPSLSLPQ